MIVGFVTKIVSRISQGNKIKIHVSSPKRFKRKEGAKTKKKRRSGACLFSLYENPPIPLSLRLIAAVRLISEYVMDLKEQRRSIPVNAKGPGSGG